MKVGRFQFREHPVSAVSAGVVAVLYWISVCGAYSAAESNVTGLGYEYLPFMILSLPWSELVQSVISLIPNHETAHVAFGISCLSLCGSMQRSCSSLYTGCCLGSFTDG